MSTDNTRMAVGVDIGGTNLKLGLIDENGKIYKFHHHPIVRTPDGIASIDHIARSIYSFMEDAPRGITTVGVCTPGNLDVKRKLVFHAVNLGWENVSLGSLLEEHINVPVTIESDVVAGAYGEYRFGSAKGKSSFLYISIGTGVGGSYLYNGSFLTTSNESVLNIGHMSVAIEGRDCGCGNKGCLEQYVSSSAILRRISQETGESVSLKDIYKRAFDGNNYFRSVLIEAGTYLGAAIVNMINLFGPGPIVVGGGVSQVEYFLMERAREVVAERIKPYLLEKTEILQASYPGEAGVLGAACRALD